MATSTISSTFLWRRVHSLMGFWLVLFLFEHLTVNSQAALWIGDDGHLFVRFVNFLESLPFLQVIEVVLIGIPLLIHGGWGIRRALSSKSNVIGSGGGTPYLPYERNWTYTMQRLSSWILLFGIIFHVIDMRFLDYPTHIMKDNRAQYLTEISFDKGLYSLGPRLGVIFYSATEIDQLSTAKEKADISTPLFEKPEAIPYDVTEGGRVELLQQKAQEQRWIDHLKSLELGPNEVVAICPSPGTAMLLHIRDTFKSWAMVSLYTLFVLAAAFHAGNGFWTFLITWGWILSIRSQKAMIPVSVGMMVILGFLGLASIWGSYWLNLRY